MEGGGREEVGLAPEGGGVSWEKADLIIFHAACSGCHVEPALEGRGWKWEDLRGDSSPVHPSEGSGGQAEHADRGAKILRCAGLGLGFPGNRPRMWLLRRRPLSSQGTGSSVSSNSGTEDSGAVALGPWTAHPCDGPGPAGNGCPTSSQPHVA